MLSWSSAQTEVEADLQAVAAGGGDTHVPLGNELLRFASAAADPRDDAVEMTAAREELIEAGGQAVMIDAAAVAANFHMMTRLADGTGARYPGPRLEAMAATIDQIGSGSMVS